jgi:hypothetical protein
VTSPSIIENNREGSNDTPEKQQRSPETTNTETNTQAAQAIATIDNSPGNHLQSTTHQHISR